MMVIIDTQGSGISGNMIVGAMVDLGLNKENVTDVMQHYGSYFGDVEVNIGRTKKSGISAVFADVQCSDRATITFKDLKNRLDGINHPDVNDEILNFSKNIFKTLAQAESRVHGTTLEDVHFHEVGASDAVADIMGASYGYYKLKMNEKKIYGMPVALGGGVIKSSHGSLIVPAPATLEILKKVPVFGGPVDYELTTPTGAAVLVNMVDKFQQHYPLITNKKIGYGAGKLDLEHPNVLRIVEGETELQTDNVSILETNLDNISGEVMGNLFDKLMQVGARDVSVIPTTTKKNRPGYLLRVIAKPKDCDIISESIIRETGTLGVRVLPYVHRNIASRKIIPIKLVINGKTFEVNIKVGMIGNEIISIKPEYEDVRKVSDDIGMPVKDVMNSAVQVFMDMEKSLK